jgi:hypothetical protein
MEVDLTTDFVEIPFVPGEQIINYGNTGCAGCQQAPHKGGSDEPRSTGYQKAAHCKFSKAISSCFFKY